MNTLFMLCTVLTLAMHEPGSYHGGCTGDTGVVFAPGEHSSPGADASASAEHPRTPPPRQRPKNSDTVYLQTPERATCSLGYGGFSHVVRIKPQGHDKDMALKCFKHVTTEAIAQEVENHELLADEPFVLTGALCHIDDKYGKDGKGLVIPIAIKPAAKSWNNDNLVRLVWQLKKLSKRPDPIILTDVKVANILEHEGVLKFSDLGGRIQHLPNTEWDMHKYSFTPCYCSPGVKNLINGEIPNPSEEVMKIEVLAGPYWNLAMSFLQPRFETWMEFAGFARGFDSRKNTKSILEKLFEEDKSEDWEPLISKLAKLLFYDPKDRLKAVDEILADEKSISSLDELLENLATPSRKM